MAAVTKPIALDETLQAVNETLGEIRDALEGGGGGDYIPKVTEATAGNVPILKADGTLEDSGETIPSKTSDLTNDSNFVSDANYVHTDNNYTSAEKTSVGQITGIKNDLTELEGEALDIKMLGWSVPKEFPIKNYMDNNRVSHRRIGRIDLGSLNWGYAATPSIGYPFFLASIDSMKDSTKNLYLVNYVVDTSDSLWMTLDKAIKASDPYEGFEINISDSSYTDVTAFKAAMQGVYLYYELANEITIPVDGNEIAMQNQPYIDYGTDAVNLNDLVYNGSYSVYLTNASNKPNTSAAYGIVNVHQINSNHNYVIQELIALPQSISDATLRFYRSCIGGNWGNWGN